MISSKIFASAATLVVSLLAATSAAAPAAACKDPKGLQWSLYSNPFTNQDQTYKQFNPTYIKKQTPQYSGSTGAVGINDDDYYGYLHPYGGQDYYTFTEHVIIDHRGYIHAPMTGIYNFTIKADDEIVLLWLHSVAYSGWTRKNAREVVAFAGDDTPNVPVTFSFRLAKGSYTPIRFVWANNRGPVTLAAELIDPLGNVLLGSLTGTNSAVVQYACSGTRAPPFQNYGQEQ